MTDLDLCELGASSLTPTTNVVKSQCTRGDEPFGELSHYQCLGITAVPWPTDEKGKAEGVVAQGVGGLPGVIIGGRDSRTNAIVANAKPGDTIVHTTGPEQSAQLQLKEAKRQAVLATKGTDGKQIIHSLDGKKDRVTIAAFGHIFQVTRDGISMSSKNGKNGIDVSDDGVAIRGNVTINTPIPGFYFMLGPVTGSPGGPASVPLIAAKGFGGGG